MPTWCGGRPVVEYSNTITIGGTWIAGETLSVTIDGVALTLTIGTSVATTDVATALQAAWEGTTLGTGYSANFYGTESARHYELVATVSGSVVTVTERAVNGGVTEGKTFPSLSSSETSASGTITVGAGNTPTGPYNFSDAANWDSGTAPANTDTLNIEGDYDVRYNIDQSATPLTTITLNIPASFTGQFGLPKIKTIALPAGDQSFFEYRQRYFKTNSGGTLTLSVGDGEGDGAELIKIDTNTSAVVATVYTTGDPVVETDPVLFLIGPAATSSFRQYGGSVGIGLTEEGTSSDCTIATVHVTGLAGSEDTATLIVGPSMGAVTDGKARNAEVTLGAVTTTDVWESLDGATISVRGAPAGSSALKAYGGIIHVNSSSGTIGTLNIAQGESGTPGSVVIAGGLGALTVTNCNMYSAGTSLTVEGRRSVTFTNDIIIGAGLNISDVTINIPPSAQSFKVQKAALA